jgi:tRNA threonylcarbamoyl adenosine modification protein (Sua5/YciO/YrdC/YwlC family)
MLIKIHPDNPDPRKMKQVIDCLKDGGVIIYPTDTVYGFACDLHSSKAFDRLCRIKGLNPEKANLSLICYDLSNITDYTKPIGNSLFRLMKKALPGPFTFIFEANSNVPKIFRSKKRTIGIRVPDNNIARQIVHELGNPIVSSSIREEEMIEYSTDPELIYEKYEKHVDIVIDGGLGNYEPSTIIDCTTEQPEIIRQGLGIIEELA